MNFTHFILIGALAFAGFAVWEKVKSNKKAADQNRTVEPPSQKGDLENVIDLAERAADVFDRYRGQLDNRKETVT